MGGLYLQSGRLPEGEKAFLAALKIRDRLVKEHSDVPVYSERLASCQTSLGVLYSTANRRDDAEKAYLAAMAIQERLLAERPRGLDYRSGLAVCHNNLGILYVNANRHSDAEKAHLAAIEIQKRLAVEQPSILDYQRKLGVSHFNLANLYRSIGRQGDAEKAYLAAIEILGRLATEHPDVPEYQNEFGSSHYNLGTLYHTTDRQGDAEKAYLEAIEIRERLVKEHPDVAEYQDKLIKSRDRLRSLRKAMEQRDEAAKGQGGGTGTGRKSPALDWPTSVGAGWFPLSLELGLVPIRRALWEEGLPGRTKDTPLRKAAEASGIDIGAPEHPLLIQSFQNGRLFYVFYNEAHNAFGDRAYLIQRIRKIEKNWVGAEDMPAETKETFSVEVMKILGGRTKRVDRHFASYGLGTFDRREVTKEFEIGFGKIEGVATGRAWPFEANILYKELQDYDTDRALYDKVEYIQSKKWTLSVSFDGEGNYEIVVPELGIHAPRELPDPESALPQPDASSAELVLRGGRGVLGLVVGESTAEDIEAALGSPLHIEPAGSRAANFVFRSALSFNVYHQGFINTIMTRPGFAGKTSKGIAHGDTRDRVMEVYGAPPRDKTGRILSYDGIIFWLDCDDRVEQIVVCK